MSKEVALFCIMALLVPSAYSISVKELLAKYSFSAVTAQMNVTNHTDFMVDKDNNGVNDTLVLELATNNSNGTFIFVVNLFDKNSVLVNEANKTLKMGHNKLNMTFDSIFLTQNQFNYSIKVYNSTYSLRYRKDNILSQSYLNYEQGFKIVGARDSKVSKALEINITLNSSVSGIFETILFLSYNNSIIFAKENKSITNSTQGLLFHFHNETMKRAHYAGNFNISLKIGKKAVKTNLTTSFYDFRDFAIKSYISNFSDEGVDINGNDKYDILQINASIHAIGDGNYSIVSALHDLFGNIVETRNVSSFLSAGKNTIPFGINGSVIYGKKLNGPFIVKYIELYENGALTDQLNDAYISKNYNFNDFDSPDLPDLYADISASGDYRYGISNITVNFTFKNMGNMPAFNVFTEIFDNSTFFRSNKSSILGVNSQIAYQLNFTNVSDFEISAIADLQDFVEELNESNNAKRVTIKLNKRPNLAQVNNITANETDKITLNLSASDLNGDSLYFSINSSKFSNSSDIFYWATTTTDSGNYTLRAAVSDGFLNDSSMFRIIVLDVPEKDIDNDGLNDSIDRLIGDKNSVNTSTINLGIFLDDSSNLSKLFNKTTKVKFMDNSLMLAEFDFNFSSYKLNLTGITINKQLANATGSLLINGLKMPEGMTKALYVDRVNTTINGICIKDDEIGSIAEVSGNCNLDNEFKVECDGTLQNSYRCAYNSTLSKYKIQGLRHSGVMQISYAKPASESSSAPASSTGTSVGGGGGVACISDWQCSEWSGCIEGIRSRKCVDASQCAFPANKPAEVQQCAIEESKTANVIKPFRHVANVIKKTKQNIPPKQFAGITAQASKPVDEKPNPGILIVLTEIFIIVGLYLAIKRKKI